MATYYPSSGIPYKQYLQANSFVKDITGQISESQKADAKNRSAQNKKLVAAQEQLARTVGEGFAGVERSVNRGFDQVDRSINEGFGRVERSLDSGFERMEYGLDNINYSIEALHSSFDYSMGLLIEEAQFQNEQLSRMVQKLDAIHKTLESPTLTKAREFYQIGSDRRSKGLLDKALEAFLEAEKINDTDCFIEYRIGSLYLYGIDEDDDVLDLEKARHHLLLAARFAKAEMQADPSFARIAAEAYFHASISRYFLLGEPGIRDSPAERDILVAAKNLVSNAIQLNPHFSEARYHFAKYCSLLGEKDLAVPQLKAAILTDRNYAIKVDIDHAFDPMRQETIDLLINLREEAKSNAVSSMETAGKTIVDLTVWKPAESQAVKSDFEMSKSRWTMIEQNFHLDNYFGYLDASAAANDLVRFAEKIRYKRAEELSSIVANLIRDANRTLPRHEGFSHDYRRLFMETVGLIERTRELSQKGSFEGFQDAIKHGDKAVALARAGKVRAENELQERLSQSNKERERLMAAQRARDLDVRREKAAAVYARTGGGLGLVLGFVFGLVGCIGGALTNSTGLVCALPIVGAVVCSIGGAMLGYILGRVAG